MCDVTVRGWGCPGGRGGNRGRSDLRRAPCGARRRRPPDAVARADRRHAATLAYVTTPAEEKWPMRIVNPAFGIAQAGSEQIQVRPVNWREDPIALFSNSQANARELLVGILDKHGETQPVYHLVPVINARN